MTQSIKNTRPPQQLHGESLKDWVNKSSRFAMYDKDVTRWRTFNQFCHIVSLRKAIRFCPTEQGKHESDGCATSRSTYIELSRGDHVSNVGQSSDSRGRRDGVWKDNSGIGRTYQASANIHDSVSYALLVRTAICMLHVLDMHCFTRSWFTY
jgi:hypothetical protein